MATHLLKWLLCCWMVCHSAAWAQSRVKDLTTIQGVRTNQLVGYGLVVGLDGTGDGSNAFTDQSFRSMLKQFGITVPPEKKLDSKNVAAVALSAELPPFIKPGQKIDVTVSSIGTSKSLRGGTLLMSPLKGADGQVYAVAQGSLVVSGFGAEGKDGSKVSVNSSSVGRIPNGATVEQNIPSPFHESPTLVLNLNRPDFTTAKRMMDAINSTLGPRTAHALDSNSIEVRTPLDPAFRMDFVSLLENIQLDTDAAPARVVFSSSTGTVVMGEHVLVRPAAVSHGSLVVTISEQDQVSQPNPFAKGDTKVVNSSSIQVEEKGGKAFLFKGGATLKDLVQAINSVGAAPGDLLAILEALKASGSIDAELIVM